MYYAGPYWYGWDYGWGFGLIHAIIGILIFAFFLWIIFYVIRLFWWDHSYSHYHKWWDDEDPIEILKKRYARGEISKEEYEQIKSDLERDMKK
ncbi:MAG: electron transporter RnfE [Mesoaciditoga sp.]|uniref:SHOCT domain-containing protein n=1 Tax=Athalassotoga sp. TaxID=2022597 RepID=UPI000CB6A27E|nr:MAG: electron transporter RnfE [Mesoaciditoga sp.]PMP78699.1 MAG: electron transporter RnfE [Mesoaciditoga sp.]HEU24307.1 SHOCT domain-containing protein [Mesoaciditoga lauensis]